MITNGDKKQMHPLYSLHFNNIVIGLWRS